MGGFATMVFEGAYLTIWEKQTLSTHQECIEQLITTILKSDGCIVEAFCRGNPFDKLLRSYDEFTADGRSLYRHSLGARHYKMSRAAFASGLDAKELYGEHRIPLKLVIQMLLNSDRTIDSVRSILRSNEVVLITAEEQRRLDASIVKGGLGLKSKLAPGGSDRLAYAGIEIAPETLRNHL